MQYAGFLKRAVALIIDSILLGVVNSILQTIGLDPIVTSIIGGVVGLGYFVYFDSSEKQGTVGKMVMKIKITDIEGNRITPARAVGRYFAKILSTIILFIGFIMAAFTEKKQALHDMIAGTLVVNAE